MSNYGIILSRGKKVILNTPKIHCREDLQRHLNNKLYKAARLTGKQVVFKIYIQEAKNTEEYLTWARALTSAMVQELIPESKLPFQIDGTITKEKKIKSEFIPGTAPYSYGSYKNTPYEVERYDLVVKLTAEVLGNPFFASFYLGSLKHLAQSIRNKAFAKIKPPRTVLSILTAMRKANSGRAFATPLHTDYKEKWKELVKSSKAGAFDNLTLWRNSGSVYDYSDVRGVNDWYKKIKDLKRDRIRALKQ